VERLRLAFAGTPDFAAQHLRGLLEREQAGAAHEVVAVLTQPDRRSGRGKRPTPGPVKVLALEHDLPVLQPTSLKDAHVQATLAEQHLDALIVVAYGLILPPAVLPIPRYGCINVHGSLLPRWRGAAPIQRAIEAGDTRSGITIMQMDAGLDTGPMLAKHACPIDPGFTSADLYARLAALGPDLLSDVLEDLPRYLANAEAQVDADATYAAKITKAEAEIDWTQPAGVVAQRVRAFNPAPGAYSHLANRRIKIWDARVASHTPAAPGTILGNGGDGDLCVACGEGALALSTLQLPGGRAVSAQDVLRGHADLFAPGATFAAVGGA